MISVVVLTHNNEKIIEQCLKSLIWCDEILVIDDNSTDSTRDLARKHKATVFERALEGDFAAQRNFGLSKAKYDWVLFIDSDEVVSKELAEEIQHVVEIPSLKSQIPNHDGYFIKRNDWMWGRELKHGETANVKLLRLAKKDTGVWERSVHEVWNVKGPSRELTHPLLHYPHANVAQFLDQINTYSTLNARYMYEHHVHSPWWRIVVNPKAKFIYNYFFRLGFLDGTPGVMVAIMMSFHSFLTRAKLYMLRQPHG